MAYCGPSCTIPSCASSPVVGFGSRGLGYGYGGFGSGSFGYGGLGYGSGGLGYGFGAGALGIGGGSATSAELGTLSGVVPQPISQIPASEVVIQPPPSVVTIPGAILSASCEPVSVGGNTPCAIGGSGIVGAGLYGGLGYGALGQGRGRFLGRKSLLGSCGSVCF